MTGGDFRLFLAVKANGVIAEKIRFYLETKMINEEKFSHYFGEWNDVDRCKLLTDELCKFTKPLPTTFFLATVRAHTDEGLSCTEIKEFEKGKLVNSHVLNGSKELTTIAQQRTIKKMALRDGTDYEEMIANKEKILHVKKFFEEKKCILIFE
jgi:hypothetical protein